MLFRVVCGSNHMPSTHQGVRTLRHLSYNRKTVVQSVMSSILSHLNSTGHSSNFDDFKILSSCFETYELMIHESLLISKLKPSLNVKGSSIPLNLLYFYCFMSSFLFLCLYCFCYVLPYTLLSFIFLSTL